MKILHTLAQRPSHTGSGTTLEALVRLASGAGHDQRVICGVPPHDPTPEVGGLDPERIHPLVFERGGLDFPLPGMSDVMPYRSSRYSHLSPSQIEAYCRAWRDHVQPVIADYRPDLIHSHHLWLLSSLLRDLAGDTPIATHVHATGLRQMELCPHLAERVRQGVRRNDRFLVLHQGMRRQVADTLSVATERVVVVGTGYRQEIFRRPAAGSPREPHVLLYAGKYSHAKGLPWLLDAVQQLRARGLRALLRVAGSGAGEEADALRKRMQAMAPAVELLGQLTQPQLADEMRRAAVFVLPSFYEGVPLVLVEALASGCRLVATRLPGVERELAPHLGDALEPVPLPRLEGPDRPVGADLPAFVEALGGALERALTNDAPAPDAGRLHHFTWSAVYQRVESVWLSMCGRAE